MSTRKLILTALFSAIGIVLPQIFHLFGGEALGQALLPMHLPVFIGAMLLGPMSGAIIAIISIFAGVLMGMPPLLIASYMFFELIVYGLVAGYLYQKLKLNIFVSYFIAKIAGMGTAILAIQFFIRVFGINFPPLFGSIYMFASGIIGIALQIILIPTTVLLLKKEVMRYEKIS